MRVALDGKVERCAGALREARRLVALRQYGGQLRKVVARTYDLFDEMDEILVGLRPARDHEAFASVAMLHREFEAIQSLIPPTRP